ncbi:AraC family transcriptional regulator [Roseixanthobacter pseudopolyaromaticivorans]|uniref:AraC family transcriptional regulator n=1 Tax=Xanthobacteraceae TaxID=335928 RepID=UPI0037278860
MANLQETAVRRLTGPDPVTLSAALIEEWLASLQAIASESRVRNFLDEAGIAERLLRRPDGRISQDQVIALYKIAAVQTGDEMMGLWSRPIRSGALKIICRTVIDAPSMTTALHRLAQVWNLLLDDHRLSHESAPDVERMTLYSTGRARVTNRFSHVIMMKLVHGIVSWLAGSEVPIAGISFAFLRPPFGADYNTMFPAKAGFEAPSTRIEFSSATMRLPIVRSKTEILAFLERAPRDWMFTQSSEHALTLKIRRNILVSPRGFELTLPEAANQCTMSQRSLTRRLAAEGTSFHEIKDDLRRDVALRALVSNVGNIESLALQLGYSAAPVLHRSFRRWTGMTPAEYRRVVSGNTPTPDAGASRDRAANSVSGMELFIARTEIAR